MKKTILKTISLIAVVLWAITGLLIIASICHGNTGWGINLGIGIIFVVIAYFLATKRSNTLQVSQLLEKDKHVAQSNRLLTLETILFILAGLFGGILLSGAYFRVFYENMPVFG